jgi:hypothetical protein
MGAWLEGRLDSAARARVRAARGAARSRLAEELATDVPEELIERGLVPPANVALALAQRLASSLPT